VNNNIVTQPVNHILARLFAEARAGIRCGWCYGLLDEQAPGRDRCWCKAKPWGVLDGLEPEEHHD